MTLSDVRTLIARHGVPDHLYSIGGLGAGDCPGIETLDGRWRTYFSERGSRWNIVVHADEDAACRAFLAGVADAVQAYTGRTIEWGAP